MQQIKEIFENPTVPIPTALKIVMMEEAKRRNSSFQYPINLLKKAMASESWAMRVLRAALELGEDIEDRSEDGSVIIRKEWDMLKFIVPTELTNEFYSDYMRCTTR